MAVLQQSTNNLNTNENYEDLETDLVWEQLTAIELVDDASQIISMRRL